MLLMKNHPPSTLPDPITEILNGVAVTDPYRWLEDQNCPRTRTWLDEQTAYARTYLGAIPHRDRIKKRVSELLAVEVVSEPWKVGSRYFFLKRQAGQEQPVIMMQDGNCTEQIVLVDPSAMGQGNATTVSILNLSLDGNILAYGIRHNGSDLQSVGFMDVVHRRILSDRLPASLGSAVVFSRDGIGFYYSYELPGSERRPYRAVYFHYFGQQPAHDVEVFFAGEDEKLHVSVFGSPDGKFIGYFVFKSTAPKTFDLYVQDLAGCESARKIIGTDSPFRPFFVGSTLLALTGLAAPNLRIVKIDRSRPDPDYWVDVVPESQYRIEGFATVESTVYVSYFDNNAGQVEAFSLADRRRSSVPCPQQGRVTLLRRPVDSDTLFYEFSGFAQPPAVMCYEPATGEQKEWGSTQTPFDAASVEIREIRYKSKDGTDVPMHVLWRKGRFFKGPMPTVLTGYGGFGYKHAPQFKASSAFLIEKGFTFAIAHVRGGGELGKEWHLAGKRQNRQNAIDDFISAAEWLLGNGYTAPQKLAISGGSNAGLLVGAALTQRPDLFRAAVCSGPLLDMLRYHRFDSAVRWVDEYGCSEDPEDFPHLVAYSPYHHVEPNLAYPAVLLISGDADTSCNPMHARKMTARLQGATSSGHPILLSYSSEWGHVPSQPLSRRIDALTDRLAFLCHELGVPE